MKARAGPLLLTGSAGYIGSALATALRAKAIAFTGVDKRPHAGENEKSFNLAEAEWTGSLVAELSPAAIIHTGTHSALAYQRDFVAAFQEDAKALVNLLDSIRSLPDARFVFFSSSYVYSGLPLERPVSETTILNPSHNFGVAKSFFEQFVSRNHPNSVVFRLSSVFGHGAQAHPNAIAEMAREARDQDRVTVWGAGTRRMQYVYLEDVVEYTLDALSMAPGTYNLGGDDYVSVAETAKGIAASFGVNVEFLTEKREGDSLPFMDTAKLKAEAGCSSAGPLAETLHRYLTDLRRLEPASPPIGAP